MPHIHVVVVIFKTLSDLGEAIAISLRLVAGLVPALGARKIGRGRPVRHCKNQAREQIKAGWRKCGAQAGCTSLNCFVPENFDGMRVPLLCLGIYQIGFEGKGEEGCGRESWVWWSQVQVVGLMTTQDGG